VKYRETLPEGARVFESCVTTQWGDVDAAGIVYFAAYWRFVERAEMDMFGELGFPYESVFQKYDFWLPRVRCEVEYHAPALMNDELSLRTHIEKVGGSSVRWKTVVFNRRTGEAGATFAITVACIDGKTLRSRPLPDPVRTALLPCVATAS
jgi:acyl-CoA thioester hydrolase